MSSSNVQLAPGTVVVTPGTPQYVVGESGGTLPVPEGFVLNPRLPNSATATWKEARVEYDRRHPERCKLTLTEVANRSGPSVTRMSSTTMPLFGKKTADGCVEYSTGRMTVKVRETGAGQETNVVTFG